MICRETTKLWRNLSKLQGILGQSNKRNPNVSQISTLVLVICSEIQWDPGSWSWSRLTIRKQGNDVSFKFDTSFSAKQPMKFVEQDSNLFIWDVFAPFFVLRVFFSLWCWGSYRELSLSWAFLFPFSFFAFTETVGDRATKPAH